tara:strand:+ start:710 stop:1246 length:537 start_codon:yes stop_codon:yes gene_type:complete
MSSKTLEIIRGLAQAAANAYGPAFDEKYSYDGEARKIGLGKEEGDIMLDKRINDGFGVKFHGNKICIKYQSDILLKDIDGKFENEISKKINQVKRYLQKEYKKITGNSVRLSAIGEPKVMVQSLSRVRSFVQAHQHFNISGIKEDPDANGSENRTVDKAIKDFLSLKSDKKPKNVTRK